LEGTVTEHGQNPDDPISTPTLPNETLALAHNEDERKLLLFLASKEGVAWTIKHAHVALTQARIIGEV